MSQGHNDQPKDHIKPVLKACNGDYDKAIAYCKRRIVEYKSDYWRKVLDLMEKEKTANA